MKYRLYIALSLLLVIILKLIQYPKQYQDTNFLHYGDMLPTLPNFIRLCIVLLTGFVLASLLQYKQHLSGHCEIRQIDRTITQQLISIAAFAVATLIIILLNNDKSLYYYFLAIFVSFMTYELATKILIRLIHPEKFAIKGVYLKERTLFRIKKRNLETLEAITYDGMNKTLGFNFQEGLDNLKINLSEHSPEDIKNLYKAIVDTTGKNLFTSDSFYDYLHNLNH